MVFKAVKFVPQSEQHVVERFGRLRAILRRGINMIAPFIDRVAHSISILERQLLTARQDAITHDNVLVHVGMSVFYHITEPKKTVYLIRDVDSAISTTVAVIVALISPALSGPVALALFAGLSFVSWIVLRALFRKQSSGTRHIMHDIND